MSWIDIYNFSITGDCGGTNSGELYLEVTGDSPNWIVTEIGSLSGLLPVSALTPTSNIYYVSGLSAGTYSFQITETTIPPTIPETEVRVFQISSGTTVSVVSSGTTCDSSNGSVTATTFFNFGVSTFELYDISNNYITSGQTSIGEDFVIFNNLSAGTYYVTGDDGGGCQGISESFIIYPSSIFTYGYYVVNNGSCVTNEGSGKIFLTGLTTPTSAYTINWLTNVNGQTGTTITGLTQGLYNVEVIDTNGCSVIQSIVVEDVAQLGLGTIILTQPNCFLSDGDITIIVTGGTAPFYYFCSNGDSAVSFDSNYTFPNLPSGVYNITVTDAGLCSFTTQTTLVTPGSFGAVTISATNSNCSANNGSITVNINNGIGSGVYNYTLSGSTGQVSEYTNQGLTQTFPSLPSGDYNIFIDDGTCIFTGTTSLTNQNKFEITGTPISTVCGLNNGVLYVNVSSGATPPINYSLFGPSSSPQLLPNQSAIIQNLAPGTYTLTVTDADACQQSIPVYIAPSNPVYFDLFGYDTIYGNDGQIVVSITSGEPPFILNWSPNVGSQSGLTITGLTTGVYTLQVIDNNGCSLTKTIKIGGTQALGNYTYTTICQKTFENTDIMGVRGIKQMFNEGFYDLTTGDTNCILNYADFKFVVTVGDQTEENIFYSSTGLTDYPSITYWGSILQDTLEGFYGVGDVIIDLENNTVKITNDCEEIQKNCGTQNFNLLTDTRFIVNMVITYNISCVECN